MIGIYHSRDLDGYTSGAIIKRKFPEATLIGFDYGQNFDELLAKIPDKEPVIMADVSLPMAQMERLAIRSGCFIWIDHHASAIKDYEEHRKSNENFRMAEHAGYMIAVLEDGIAACEGTWKYLFPNLQIPPAVELLGQYDTWRNQDKDLWDNYILPFQYGMRLNVKNAETFPQYLLEPNTANDCIAFIEEGEIVLKYQKQQSEISMKKSFVMEFEGLRCLACNGGAGSTSFESVWDEEKHDLMMTFKYTGEQWVFGMYTTKDIDLSVIAKKYGGGGHKKACGFQIDNIPSFIFKEKTETLGLLLKATQNLGHPAYEHSYSTNQAINELREEIFDFLGIPKAEDPESI